MSQKTSICTVHFASQEMIKTYLFIARERVAGRLRPELLPLAVGRDNPAADKSGSVGNEQRRRAPRADRLPCDVTLGVRRLTLDYRKRAVLARSTISSPRPLITALRV